MPVALCSWEAIEHELQNIGVHPHCWPLPLSQAAVREAEKNPIAQPIPQVGWVSPLCFLLLVCHAGLGCRRSPLHPVGKWAG